jgi:hypothetical protein
MTEMGVFIRGLFIMLLTTMKASWKDNAETYHNNNLDRIFQSIKNNSCNNINNKNHDNDEPFSVPGNKRTSFLHVILCQCMQKYRTFRKINKVQN